MIKPSGNWVGREDESKVTRSCVSGPPDPCGVPGSAQASRARATTTSTLVACTARPLPSVTRSSPAAASPDTRHHLFRYPPNPRRPATGLLAFGPLSYRVVDVETATGDVAWPTSTVGSRTHRNPALVARSVKL